WYVSAGRPAPATGAPRVSISRVIGTRYVPRRWPAPCAGCWMSSPPETPRQRLFFALWPPPELVRPLAALVRRHAPAQARQVHTGNLHVTLAFVGAVTADTRACLEQAAASVQGEAFELVL